MADSINLTGLLSQAGRGNSEAWLRVMPLVYEELRAIAGAAVRRESSANTLNPTALVHEAYLRLSAQNRAEFPNRLHFFAAASEVMRRVLVDHARARKSQKRGGGAPRADLDSALLSFEERSTDLLALDAALQNLAALSGEQARIVELRFFGGLSVAEAAEALGVSVSTIERGWRLARAFLLREVETREA